jgi:hypothetical protein
VRSLKSSPSRLPAKFANQIYDAGESGMGYTIFTVEFEDGSRQAYSAGNAVDFVQYPSGQTESSVVGVVPHIGRGEPSMKSAPGYFWCLYETN